MAEKKNKEISVNKQEDKKYKGSQLLKMPKYKTLVAKVVIKPNELYSFEEADKLIANLLKKKG